MIINVKLSDNALLPIHAKPGDAGLDLTSREDVSLQPGSVQIVTTGVCVEIPEGYFGLVAPRSGLSSKHGITLANTPGIIDSGYRGEIHVPLYNIGKEPYEIHKGDRVCQLIIVPYASCQCIEVDDMDHTDRGDTGFGSSGI